MNKYIVVFGNEKKNHIYIIDAYQIAHAKVKMKELALLHGNCLPSHYLSPSINLLSCFLSSIALDISKDNSM